MCGIAGIARLDGHATSKDVAAVLRMLDAQVHRGPDDWGLLLPRHTLLIPEAQAMLEQRGLSHVRTYLSTATTSGAVLGSRRLSIIDLSPRGRMPMGSGDGRVWITYNGEIYNARDLREELKRLGYSFQSDTDTETILHGYEEWGEEVIQRLRGMFAFAVLDTTESPRLLLVRDRIGIKPLYYYQDGSVVIFASEVRAIMRSGLVPNEWSVQALIRFLQLGSVPQPLTTVKDVLALPPAHSLSVGPHATRRSQYWDLSNHLHAPTAIQADSSDCVLRTRTLLEESVKLHLVSDAPLGVFLSGGTDSSSLVALADQFSDRPLTTVSITFEEPAFDESTYARLIAERYRTQHHELRLRHKDVFGALPGVFAAMDQPSIDGVNSYFVSKAAMQAGVTVVLSGTGGDEVFLGYDHFKKARLLDRPRRLFGTLPAWLRRSLLRVAKQAPTRVGKNRLDRILYLETPLDHNTYLLFRGLFSPYEIQDLLGMSEREFLGLNSDYAELGSPVAYSHSTSSAQSLVDSFILLEFAHYLNDQLLKDIDFMSMAHSIETRVPYLDHKLVEYAVALASSGGETNSMSKWLLIEAMRGDLPREVWDRPKMGFTIPFAEWIEEYASDLQGDQERSEFLEPIAVRRAWQLFQRGRLHWSRIWALTTLTTWCRESSAWAQTASSHWQVI